MNRRDFLRQLSHIAAGAIILPSIEQVLAVTQPRRKYWPGWSVENRYIIGVDVGDKGYSIVAAIPYNWPIYDNQLSIVYGDIRSNRGIDIGSEQRLIPTIGTPQHPNAIGYHVP